MHSRSLTARNAASFSAAGNYTLATVVCKLSWNITIYVKPRCPARMAAQQLHGRMAAQQLQLRSDGASPLCGPWRRGTRR